MENPAPRLRRKNDLGPSGQRAGRNLQNLREERRFSQKDLAAAVERLGRPMIMQIVSKTEAGERRLDIDDLIAFAVALDTSPNRLLLTGSAAADQFIDLTPAVRISELDAWNWASGLEPLPAETGKEPGSACRREKPGEVQNPDIL